MFAALLQAGGQPQHDGFVLAWLGDDRHQRRFALRQRARLVHHEGVHLAEDLDGFGVSEQHPDARALSGRHHDRHGRGEAERARARDDQDGDGRDERVRHSRLRADQRPGDEREHRGRDHGGHEVGRHRVGQALDGRAGALRLADHAHDLREQGLGADPLGAHDEAAGRVHRGPDDALARVLLDRHRLAGHHRLVHRARALGDDAVHRHLLARPDPQQVADLDLLERHVLLAPIRRHPARLLRREAKKRANR